VNRWNEIIKNHGVDFTLTLPHRAFRRAIGAFAEVRVSPDGRVVSQAEWDARHRDWLPTDEDAAYVGSLMKAVTERGKMAGWIAPPARGVNSQAEDFEYVRLS
jgi:benzoyl-CoA 2,3-dioxygenase component B